MLRGGEMFTLAMFALLGIFVMISGSNFLVHLPGPGTAHAVQLRPGGAAPRPRHGHRGGDEVLRARRDGQRLPALRPVDALRRDRLARHRHRVQDRQLRPGEAPGAGVRPGVHRRRPGVQAGRRAVPHVDSRRLPGRADGGDDHDRQRAGAGGLRHRHPPAGGRPAAAGHRLAADAGDLAIGSLLVGNLAAIAQTNLKRMLAYSTIGQMGFVLLGLLSGVVNGNTLVGRQRLQLGDVLHRHLRADHAGDLRHHPAAGARRLRERGDRRPGRPEPAQPAVRRRDGRVPVLAGRRAAAGGLLCQAGGAAGAGGFGPGRCTSGWRSSP